MPRSRPVRSSCWVLLALLAVPALAGCSGDDEPAGAALPVGSVLDTPGQVEGVGTFVQLPLGRVDLTVSSPRTRLPTYDDTYDRAPEGGSLVGVGWSWDVASVVPGMLDPEQPEPEPAFVLVADGARYPLDEAFLRRLDDDDSGLTDRVLDFDGSAWVAVEGRPSDLEVEVTYDGLTQVVDPEDTGPRTDAGSADLLYSSPTRLAPRQLSCGDPVLPGSRDTALDLPDASCRATASFLPYRQGVGWAPVREPWLVVEVVLGGGAVATWSPQGRLRESYSVDDLAEPLLDADGTAPVSTTTSSDASTTLAVLPGSAAGATLDVETAATTAGGSDEPDAPRDPTTALTWSLDLPAVP